MKASQQTIQQIERALRKVAGKFPEDAEPLFTDIHLLVNPYTGEIRTYNDDDEELDRCVVEQWIDYKEDDFFTSVIAQLRNSLESHRSVVENMSILKPFSFVLENEDHEHIAELMVVDGDTIILGGDLMDGLDDELDDFLANLLK